MIETSNVKQGGETGGVMVGECKDEVIASYYIFLYILYCTKMYDK